MIDLTVKTMRFYFYLFPKLWTFNRGMCKNADFENSRIKECELLPYAVETIFT